MKQFFSLFLAFTFFLTSVGGSLTVLAEDTVETAELEIISEAQNTAEFLETQIAQHAEINNGEENEQMALQSSSSPSPEQQNSTPKVPQDPFTFLKGLEGNFDTDLFTGNASYSYPLWVPKGRGNMMPNLAVSYSSSNTQKGSMVGYGWNLTSNSIFRNTAKGIDKLYTEDDYAASFFGQYAELVKISENEYRAKIGTGIVQYIKISNTQWEVIDGNGTKYFFGGVDAVHQNPQNSDQVYKWMLTKAEDIQGNILEYEYQQEDGKIFPTKIFYGKNILFRSGNNSLGEHLFEINFLYENSIKQTVSYQTGFAVHSKKRLQKIEIFSLPPVSSSSEKIKISTENFEYSPIGYAFEGLSKISRTGKNLESLPPVQFDYYQSADIVAGQKIGLLKNIFLPLGGQIEISYKPSTSYRTSSSVSDLGEELANPHLPFIVHTVHQVSKSAGQDEPFYTTEYNYSGGHYFFDPQDSYTREYAGFAKVGITNAIGEITQHYFHQSEFSENTKNFPEISDHISKKGKIFKTEIFSSEGKKVLENFSFWKNIDTRTQGVLPLEDNDEINFVFLEKEISTIFSEKNSESKSTGSSYEYDEYGNVIKNISYFEVSENFSDIDSSDTIISTTEYSQNVEKNIFGIPFQYTSEDTAGNILSQSKTFYDGLELGQIEIGNPTKTLVLAHQDEKFLETVTQYNEIGLPIKTTNARNFSTTIEYDDQKIFPVKITNPKGHEISLEYDEIFSSPKKITDSNGSVVEVKLDGLGRMLWSKKMHPQTGDLMPNKTFTYDLAHYPPSIYTETHLGHGNITTSARQYFDGFGRTTQGFTETEGQEKFVMASVVYDELGRQKKIFFPQFVDRNDKKIIDLSDVGTEQKYDTLGRVIEIKTPVGSSEILYDLWDKILTDSNGNQKKIISDSRGNVIEVVEDFGTSISTRNFSTKYSYDIKNQLIKIRDAENNEKNFTYNFLGQKISEELLHKQNTVPEEIFSWEYQYDENGYLQKSTDPNNNISTFAYDELDRVKTQITTNSENSGTGKFILTEYFYDTALNGIGKIAEIDSEYLTTKFEYDRLGNTASEQKIFRGVGIPDDQENDFITQYRYDLQGNVLQIITPNGLVTKYLYSTAGQISGISICENFENCIQKPVINSVEYNELGKISQIQYSNGIAEKNIFERNKGFRLQEKISQKIGDENILQQFKYSYDRVGNITAIEKNTPQETQTTQYTYDALYRLLSATLDGKEIRKFEYSPTGNILSSSDIGGYFYKGIHPQAATQAAGNQYQYDTAGNLIQKNSEGKIEKFSYDSLQRLSTITREIQSEPTQEELADNTSIVVQNFYDQARNRIVKNSSASQSLYINQFYEIRDGEKIPQIYLGTQKIATLKKNLSTSCATPPEDQTWEIWESCVISTDIIALQSIIVYEPAVVTVKNNATVYADLKKNFLIVKKNAGFLIRKGSTLKQGTVDTAVLSVSSDPESAQNSSGVTAQSADLSLLSAKNSDQDIQVLSLGYTPQSVSSPPVKGEGSQSETGGLSMEDTQTDTQEIFSLATWQSKSSDSKIILENFVQTFETSEVLNGQIKNNRIGKFPSITLSETEPVEVVVVSTPLPVIVSTPVIKQITTKISPDIYLLPAPQNISPLTREIGNFVPQSATAPTGIIFHLSDHLGSTSIDLDERGEKISSTEYFPFGGIRTEENFLTNYTNPYKYTGKELDEETKLYYYESRYYDSHLKRFTSVDPWEGDMLDPQSLNKYSYVRNNPVMLIDPSGEEPRLGQLGNLNDIKLEMLKKDIITFQTHGGSTSMAGYANHFEGNRFFRRNSEQKLVDDVGSKNVKRYIYTEDKGWIDMHHFFLMGGISDFTDRESSSDGYLGEIFQSLKGSKSAFSYEDLTSNKAGIEFANKYGDKMSNNEISLFSAVGEYLESLTPINPEEAPNFQYIPHVIYFNSPYLTSYSSKGLKGDNLKALHKSVFESKPEWQQDKINNAHTQISK